MVSVDVKALLYRIVKHNSTHICLFLISGSCIWPSYEPPHCIGYEFMEIREGFSIPCGRGRDSPEVFGYFITFFTLGLLYLLGLFLE